MKEYTISKTPKAIFQTLSIPKSLEKSFQKIIDMPTAK
jgi:hypothetical protein